MSLSSDFPRFETRRAARIESEFRQKVLGKSDMPGAQELSRVLAECSPTEMCRSAACPPCFRVYREEQYAKTLPIVCASEQAYLITVLYLDRLLDDRELDAFDPTNLKARLWKQLSRAGFAGTAIGSLEIDYRPEYQRWLPHFHLIATGSPEWTRRFRTTLSTTLGDHSHRPDSTRPRPLHVKPLKDIPDAITYAFKSYWKRVEGFRDSSGKRQTRHYRLKGSRLVLSLLTLHRIGYRGLRFVYGTR